MPNRLSRRRRATSDTNSDSAVSSASSVDVSFPEKKRRNGFFRNLVSRKKADSGSESIEGDDDNTEPDDSSVDVKISPRLNSRLGRRGKRRSSSPPDSSPIPSESDGEEDRPRSTATAVDPKEPSGKSKFLERLKLRHPWQVSEDGKYETRRLGLFERMRVGGKLESLIAEEDRLDEDADRQSKVQENQMAELVREVDDDSDEELQSIMKPLLREPAIKARVAEALHAIRMDTKLRSDVSQRLLCDLGDLGDLDNDDDCDVCGGPCKLGEPGRLHLSATGEKLGEGEGSSLSPASQASYSAESAPAGGSDGPTGAARFMHWTKMIKQPDLPALNNFEKDRQDMILAGYEGFNFNIGVGGFSLGLDNFLKMVRGFFFKHDIVALWKSNPRSIRVPDSEVGKIGREDLVALEKQVLDTEKFFGLGKWLTCLTYNKGANGTITLFSVEMSPRSKGEPRKIRPVAAMDRVPKVILRSIQSRIPSSQRVVVRRKGKYEGKLKWTLPVTMQEPQFKSVSVNQYHGELPAALQHAFFTVNTAEGIDSVSTTVPQMLAALHVSSPILEDVKTGRARFDDNHGMRTVEWKKEPVWTYHENANPQSVVLMPKQGAWVNERVLWL